MATDLGLLADKVGADERTLRRAVNRGTIHARRDGPRRISLSGREYDYVRGQWSLLGRLIGELRTLPHVRLAVVFGSVARGDAGPESDLDVLVRFREDTIHARALAGGRLERAAGRHVQFVAIDDASPLLLADVLRDGRVLIDRANDWPRLKARQGQIEREAARAGWELDAAGWRALEELGAA